MCLFVGLRTVHSRIYSAQTSDDYRTVAYRVFGFEFFDTK